MSIAISVQLQPSLTLLRFHYASCVLLLLVALSMWWMDDVPSGQRVGVALLCLTCVLASVWCWQHRQKHYRLVIAGDGKMHLLWRTALGVEQSSSVELAAGSTIWPSFMLLRLRPEAGKIHSLLVFRDTTSRENFRAIAVAIRWIMRRKLASENGDKTVV